MRVNAATVLLLALCALLARGLTASGAGLATIGPPFASGDAAANITLNSSNRWVVTRWVARHTGVVRTIYFRIKLEGARGCSAGTRPGYAAGTTGMLLATTHPVLASGAPDMSVTLATSSFRPCGHDDAESVAVGLGFPVVKGQEFGTVIRNLDGAARTNYFSQNFLYATSGVVGANGRNERDPNARNIYYGLDPRELVGFSWDTGRTWLLPGGNYGVNGGKAFIPTYVQQYTDGYVAGQPYYSSTPLVGPVTMVYRVDAAKTAIALGAYTSGPGSAMATLSVDGVAKATVKVSGVGFVSAAIPPVAVRPGQVITVSTTAGPQGLALRANYTAPSWVSLMQLGKDRAFYLAQKPEDAVPIYPIMQ